MCSQLLESTATPQTVTPEVTDAELVSRATRGEVAAFDQLVLRHRQSVLHVARGIIGHWDESEDAAQQAFIEAYAGLRGLQEPGKFKPWLMMIARRSALRRRSSFFSRPSTLGDFESLICSFPMSQAPPADQDVAERIRESIEELSARGRQVITLHYLDGYSCREVGQRLGIPDGTIRRILHESRNDLRAGVGLEARGGTPQMESLLLLNEERNRPEAHGLVDQWRVARQYDRHGPAAIDLPGC